MLKHSTLASCIIFILNVGYITKVTICIDAILQILSIHTTYLWMLMSSLQKEIKFWSSVALQMSIGKPVLIFDQISACMYKGLELWPLTIQTIQVEIV